MIMSYDELVKKMEELSKDEKYIEECKLLDNSFEKWLCDFNKRKIKLKRPQFNKRNYRRY